MLASLRLTCCRYGLHNINSAATMVSTRASLASSASRRRGISSGAAALAKKKTKKKKAATAKVSKASKASKASTKVKVEKTSRYFAAKSKDKNKKDERPAKSKVKKMKGVLTPLERPFKPSPLWEEQYATFEYLRARRDAPVDDIGCERLADMDDKETYRYQTLIALMLSSQTKDQTTAEAMEKLKAHGLTVRSILKTSPEKLNAMISKVGFHNNKTKYIKRATEILAEKHGSKVPPNVADVLALPGVGPKMAFILFNVAFDAPIGIGVDTHVHRIANQLGWAKGKTPEHTRVQLESWLPREKWSDINVLLVGIGQMMQQPAERPKLVAQVNAAPTEAVRVRAKKLLLRLGMKKAHFDDANE